MFAPFEQDLEFAREVVDAYDRAMQAGIGAIRVRGRMIDRPIVEQARAVLARGASTLAR